MKIALIDCGAGNLHSARKALERVMPTHATLSIATSPPAIREASHIVLPGVGAFADCMRGFTALAGVRAAVEEAVLARRTPFLGICVGMQMLFTRGYEHGEHAGLGWFEGEVRRIAPRDVALKIPHMGWNMLQVRTPAHPLLQGITSGDAAYFVHSYAASVPDASRVLADVDYGGQIVSVVGDTTIMGTQFHPEKSQAVGLRLLHNFLTMGPV